MGSYCTCYRPYSPGWKQQLIDSKTDDIFDKQELFESPPIANYLGKEEFSEMVKLAKELGMLKIGDYILYSMREILYAHKGEIKQGEPSLEVC
jgi:hypothetical protein